MPIGIDPAIDRNTGARAPGKASSALYLRTGANLPSREPIRPLRGFAPWAKLPGGDSPPGRIRR